MVCARRLGGRALLLLVLTLSAGWLVQPRATLAQDTLRAAVVVNDEVISELELTMRLRLALVSSGLPDNQEARDRLQPQVLRALIDEAIQTQEARRLNITVEDEVVEETFGRIAQNNNITTAQLEQALNSAGILPAYLKDQIRAQLTWQAVVQRRLRPQVQVTDEEVDEAVSRLEATKDQPQRLLAEIFLAVENVAEEETVRQQAYRLVEEMRRGASFQALARQFSQSASAANGGDLGWVEAGQLPAELEQGLAGVPVGQLSSPIETQNGFYIILVRDQRMAPESGMTIDLRQVFFPVQERTQANLERAARQAFDAANRIQGCDTVEAAAVASGAVGSTDLGTVALADLPSNVRGILSSIPIGQPTQPVEVPGGVAVLVVCDRQDSGINRDRVRERLVREKLEVVARRYMRDLRRAATIDIRL